MAPTTGEPQIPEAAPVELAVNGTLMRGLALNGNLLAVGATFLREDETAPLYRLWSMDDRYPAMLRVNEGGVAIALEVWRVPAGGLATILLQEPPGLTIGKLELRSGQVVLGVLAEAYACETAVEISQWGGWRAYMASATRLDPLQGDDL